MKNISFLSLILLLTIFQWFATAQDDLITKTCKQTPYYQLCTSTLKSQPQCSTETTKDLILHTVDAVKAKSIAILEEINEFRESNPKLEDRLSKCREIYEAVVNDHIPKLVEALDKDDYESAKDIMSEAAKGVKESAKILFGIGRFIPLVKLLFQLFSIIKAIVKLLHGGLY